MAVTLGYWKIRGIAQPIRLLLKYTGTEFKEVNYIEGDGPDYSMDDWLSVKFTLGLDFPNLPYLIDGDIKLTQSTAILRYIASKHNLCGKTLEERTRVDMLDGESWDMKFGLVGVVYNPNFESQKDDFIKNVKARKLNTLSKFLGSNPWFAGNEITYVDFVLYEILDVHRLLQADVFDEFDNLKAFLDRFESLPAIRQYMDSPDFIKYPLNMKKAAWGGK